MKWLILWIPAYAGMTVLGGLQEASYSNATLSFFVQEFIDNVFVISQLPRSILTVFYSN